MKKICTSKLYVDSHYVPEKNKSKQCAVENCFGNLKLHTLEGQKNLKCSRFIRKLRLELLALKVEYKPPQLSFILYRENEKRQKI